MFCVYISLFVLNNTYGRVASMLSPKDRGDNLINIRDSEIHPLYTIESAYISKKCKYLATNIIYSDTL